ncbi:MAG: helix-turn-helix domain-containing protein [Anaerolineales bacterium]
MTSGNPGLLTVKEVTEQLRVSPKTVYRLCRSGQLPAIKIGKEWRIDRADLDRFLAKKKGIQEVLSLENILRKHLQPPEHILFISSDPAQIHRLQAEFIQVGLATTHTTLVGYWWQKPADMRRRLVKLGLPVGDLEASGRLSFCDFGAAYKSQGPQGVFELWGKYASYGGGGVLWSTASLRISDWRTQPQDLIRFESQNDAMLKKLPIVALCPCLLDPVDSPNVDTHLRLIPHHSGILDMSTDAPCLMKVVR